MGNPIPVAVHNPAMSAQTLRDFLERQARERVRARWAIVHTGLRQWEGDDWGQLVEDCRRVMVVLGIEDPSQDRELQ